MRAVKILLVGLCGSLFSCSESSQFYELQEDILDVTGDIITAMIYIASEDYNEYTDYTFFTPPEWVQGIWSSEYYGVYSPYDDNLFDDILFKITGDNIERHWYYTEMDYNKKLNIVGGSFKIIEENKTTLNYEINLEYNDTKREILVFTYVSDDEILFSWDNGSINDWDNRGVSESFKLYLRD